MMPAFLLATTTTAARGGDVAPPINKKGRLLKGGDKHIGYTQWNLMSVLLVSCLTSLDRTLLPMVLCSCTGILSSFNLGFVLERDGLSRLIEQNGFPGGWVFHVVNTIIHVLPVPYMMYLVTARGVEVHVQHGLWTAALHLLWGLLVSRGTLFLDHIYAPMKPSSWYVMWLAAVLSEAIIIPYFF